MLGAVAAVGRLCGLKSLCENVAAEVTRRMELTRNAGKSASSRRRLRACGGLFTQARKAALLSGCGAVCALTGPYLSDAPGRGRSSVYCEWVGNSSPLSIVAKVRAVRTVAAVALPRNTVANRRRWSRGFISLSQASRRRTPAGFTVNSRGWSEARATPPDTRRSAPEPRRGSPGTRPSTARRMGPPRRGGRP